VAAPPHQASSADHMNRPENMATDAPSNFRMQRPALRAAADQAR